ncbi:MAG: hypothetical protein JKX75_01085, partial [Gammaproteobacteria bacterium]|nr:hypothetical protein [Gammaproteobacteria bacterium]
MHIQTTQISDLKSTTTLDSRPIPLLLKIFQLAFKIGGHISPSLTGCAAYSLWITPQRYNTPNSEQAARDSALIKHHEINGKKIATYQWGETGDIILLIHGWSGRATQ